MNMRCRRCLTTEAEFYISAKSHGQVGLCYRCAEESGILSVLRRVESVIHGYTGRGGPEMQGSLPLPVVETCQTCGMTLREFERDLLFGCADCSHLFVSLIFNFISVETGIDVEQLSLYRASAPHFYKVKQKINRMQIQLKEAIAREDYRKAAEDRDKIQRLEDSLRSKRKRSLSVLSKRKKVQYLPNEKVVSLLTDHGGAEDPAALRPWMETRIEVRRNFAEFLFPHRMDEVHQAFLREYVYKAIPDKYLKKKYFVDLSELNPFEKKVLEQRTVRRKLSKSAVVVTGTEPGFSFILNDQDHLCTLYRDSDANAADFPKAVSDFHRRLQAKVDFAFNPRFGYLTTCPRDLGSGARVVVALHLPFSIAAGLIFLFQSEAEKRKLNFEPFSGFSIERHGFYRISARNLFGRSEKEQAKEVFDFARWLEEKELKAKEKVLEKNIDYVEKLTDRLVNSCRTMHRGSYQDVLRLITYLELALQAGLIEWDGYSRRRMLATMTSPYIQYSDGRRHTINECETLRGHLFSEIVQKNVRLKAES